jgi:protein TonB
VGLIAGALAATALAAGGAWFFLGRKAPEPPAVAMKAEPPKVEAPRVEPPKGEAPAAPAPEPRKVAPRSEPARPRPHNEGEKLLSAITGAARSVGSTVGSTTQSVLNTVGDKARALGGATGYATPVSRSMPAFPPAAAAQGIRSGTVRARLDIDAAGHVTHVEVLSSDPPRVFDQEAIRTLNRWRFNTGADGRRYDAELEFRR